MASESIISAIDAEIATLQQARSLLVGDVSNMTIRKATKVSGKPTKHVMSPETRERIAGALRKRWAATKKANAVTPPKSTKKATKETSPVTAKKAAPKTAAKRTMSPESRERIADAQRKRWAAAKRATKKTVKNASPKKAAKAAPAVAMAETPKAEATS
jgi:hypothetical protein